MENCRCYIVDDVTKCTSKVHFPDLVLLSKRVIHQVEQIIKANSPTPVAIESSSTDSSLIQIGRISALLKHFGSGLVFVCTEGKHRSIHVIYLTSSLIRCRSLESTKTFQLLANL